MNAWAQLFGGGVLLYFGAQWLVGGASALALALRIPQLIVGLTVVAYGTSAPELVVSLQAASTGHADVVLGNVIGSNVANIGLILGISALISPARVDGGFRRAALPVLLASTLCVPFALLDGTVQRWEGVVLLLGGVAYTIWMTRIARTSQLSSATTHTAVAGVAADVAGAPKPMGALRAAATAAFGLGVLIFAGSLFVDGAVAVAHKLGMSERLVGLTVVAVGTSLPELVTSIIAAKRGHSDLAIGNVVGSSIFNILLCLGAAAVARPLAMPLVTLAIDLLALFVMTLLAAVFIRTERTISRIEGALALLLYIGFMTLTAVRG